MHNAPIHALRRADARAGWGTPGNEPAALDQAPRVSAARRLARAWVAGPLRDTAMITLGALLVLAGYLLRIAVVTAGAA